MRRTTLKNSRGVALLLATYFVSLTLLILGGLALQRTITELRAAQINRDVQQSFYLAEAGVDQMLSQLRAGSASFTEGQPFPCATTAANTTNCVVNTLSTALLPAVQGSTAIPKLETLYQLTPTAITPLSFASQTSSTNVSTTVSALLRSLESLGGGVIAKGTVWLGHRDWAHKKTQDAGYEEYTGWYAATYETIEEPIIFHGHIESSAGTADSIHIGAGVTVDGNITIGPSNDQNPYGVPYTAKSGVDDWSAAVVMEGPTVGYGQNSALVDLKTGQVTGKITTAPMTPLPDAPVQVPQECQATLPASLLLNAEGGKPVQAYSNYYGDWVDVYKPVHYDIVDGFSDSETGLKDLTPKGDGRVVLCVDQLNIEKGSVLTIHDPTVIYVSGGVYNDGQIRVVGTAQKQPDQQPDRGFTLIDASGSTYDQGYYNFRLGDFEGSVYAPEMLVTLGPSVKEQDGIGIGYQNDWQFGYTQEYYNKEWEMWDLKSGRDFSEPTTRQLGFIVAHDIQVNGADVDFGIRKSGNTFTYKGKPLSAPRSAQVTVEMWAAANKPMRGKLVSVATNINSSGQTTQSPPMPDNTPPPPSPTPVKKGGGGGGGPGGFGASVICTELYHQGYIPQAWFLADHAYARAHLDGETIAAYQAWARPVVSAMRRSGVVTQLIRPLAVAWAKHMAFVMGASAQDSRLGAVLSGLGIPLHQAVGHLLVRQGFVQPAVIEIPQS